MSHNCLINVSFLYFNIYCSVCHGIDMKGRGVVVERGYPQPPYLLSSVFHQNSKEDGCIFHVISHGSAIMPSYGYALDIHERWSIINYIRKKQETVKGAQ